MAQLSGTQVAQLALDVGIPVSALTTCVAIAWAESGLRTDATGYNYDPQTHSISSRDRGLWQINDYWHPDVSDDCAYDATCNAQAMYRISSHGTNWNPWATFVYDVYKNYWAGASAAVAQVTANQSPPGPPATENPADTAARRIRNGDSVLNVTKLLLQQLVDEAMDIKHGPGNRPGPVLPF